MAEHRPTRHRVASDASGFTISEFVLVVVVLVGLISVVVVSVNGIGDDRDERECRTELRAIKAAAEQFQAELGTPPANDQALEDAYLLKLEETPNWKVVSNPGDDHPRFVPQGDRCR